MNRFWLVGLSSVVGLAALGATVTAAPSDEAQAVLDDLVAAAEAEGKVTVYSSQNTGPFANLVDGFRAAYPNIEVEAVRMVDTEILPRVEIELSTGSAGADVVVVASPDWVRARADAEQLLDASASPAIAGLTGYDAELFVHDGNYFEVSAAIATLAWNTDLVPDGLTSYTELLDEQFSDGRIGVVDPAISPAVVDFWLWQADTFGADFAPALAEQQPRIYPGAGPLIEAISSGEVSAGTFSSTSVLAEAIANGAPVDFVLDEAGAWGTRFYGFLPASAAHPAAGALFTDFMLSPAGQELVAADAGSVLPDIPGTLITNDRVREWDSSLLTPEKIEAFNAEWDSLFR